MTQMLSGQRPSMLIRHDRPVKSKLLSKKLPAFTASRSSAEAVMEEQEREQETEEEIAARREYNAETLGPKSPFEDQVDAVLTCIGSQNSLREILYKILVFCKERREFGEVEQFIQSTPEGTYNHLLQEPYTLIHMLLKERGLEGYAYDEQGALMEGEEYEGYTPQDMQNLAHTYQVQTTAAGAEACELISPERRFESLLMQHPHRAETYYRFMAFCQTPRKLPEIEEFYENNDDLAHDTVQIHHTLSADFYIDKLEKAGVLVWMGAWQLNEAGKEILAAHEAQAPEE
ncbi:MAG: hypothetical protein ACOX69_01995 [Coriobacteriales bacterium]|jgi:hypothetical protein